MMGLSNHPSSTTVNNHHSNISTTNSGNHLIVGGGNPNSLAVGGRSSGNHMAAQHLNQQLHGPPNPSSIQGLLGGSNLMQGGFGSGGLPHSSLMAYPPPLTSNNNTNNSNTNNSGIENAGGFPNRS